MRPTLILRRTPMIKFLGKRTYPKQADHAPQPHPASPTHELPQSFASYRQKAQQHGPLGGKQQNSNVSTSGSSSPPRPSQPPVAGFMAYGAVGGRAGRELGSIKPKEGEYFDISELPKRFRKRIWSDEEMNAISSGGASQW